MPLKKLLLIPALCSLIATGVSAATHPLVGSSLGAWPSAQSLANIESLQQRHVDIAVTWISFDMGFSSIRTNADACYNNGTLLLISWMPNGLTCAQIAAGVKDAYIRQMAQDIKSWGHEIRIRPMYECNGNWFSWAMAKPENPPADYRRAFRHIVDIFRAEGTLNVKWEYNINFNNSPGGTFMDGYPGDDYVDLVGIDGYNWGITQSWSSWTWFKTVFDTAYQVLAARHKPISISEWGCAEAGGNKAAWIADAFDQIRNSGDYDLIESTIWFQENKETDWRINSTPAVLEAYKNAIAYTSGPVLLDEPRSASAADGAPLALSVKVGSLQGATFQWYKNGQAISGATNADYTIGSATVQAAGSYSVVTANSVGSVTSANAIVGVSTADKVLGAGTEVSPNVLHPNGNTFDQVLLTGAAEAITAEHDKNQITRTSYVDMDNDIVQVEFSGPGTLSLVLDTPTGPAAPVNYNQPGTSYMKGHAGIVITGATELTNVSVFTVGRATAFDPTGTFDITEPIDAANVPANNGSLLFQGHGATVYDGIADIAFIAIASANGKFGGVRTANANYFASNGLTGIYAPGVAFQGPVYIGDISAHDFAQPVIVLGSASDTLITGGDMLQGNSQPVQVSGIAQLKFTAGGDSHGTALPALVNQAVYTQNGSNITAQIVVNPVP